MGLRQKASDLIDNAGEKLAMVTTLQSRINFAFVLAIVACAIAVIAVVK